jgi:hypothetical protein
MKPPQCSHTHQRLYNGGKNTCPILFTKIFLILIEFSDENNKISIIIALQVQTLQNHIGRSQCDKNKTTYLLP